jgi:hypothetical protein
MGLIFDDETLERLTNEFMDEGQVLEAGWVGFRAMCLPKDVHPETEAAFRQVYFIGAKCLMTAMEVTHFSQHRITQLQAELIHWDEGKSS